MARKRRDNTYGPAGLPELPNPVDDNQLLAASTTAADQDRMSGAYDEFLFSENGLEQMPYERAVDDRLSLVQVRLLDRGRRAALAQRHALIDAEAQVISEAHTHKRLEEEIDALDAQLEEQRQILAGEKPGKEGLMWRGAAPEQTSLFSGFIRLFIPIGVFILVGGVDIFVIVNSFNKTGMDFPEALMFSAPTLGVQLVFPHLIGDRIRLLLHGHKRRIVDSLEAGILGVIWIAFAFVLTVIRVSYVAQENKKIDQMVLDVLAFGVFFMLIGLGSWLMLMTARSNPHEFKFSRLNFAKTRLEARATKSKLKLSQAQARIPAFQAALEVAEAGYEDAVSSARGELAEAAKSIYRRALVNQVGDVNFSAAYLTGEIANSSTVASRNQRRAKRTASRPAETPITQSRIENQGLRED